MQSNSSQLSGRLSHVALVVAMTKEHVIGAGQKIPWHLPDDLRLFKQLTMGGTVIMGRKTYESIGHALPGRHNIVLSRHISSVTGAVVCSNIMAALAEAARLAHPVFVIGGAEVYRRALPIATELHISWVKETFRGEVYFPELDLAEWQICDGQDYPDFHYIHYRRKSHP